MARPARSTTGHSSPRGARRPAALNPPRLQRGWSLTLVAVRTMTWVLLSIRGRVPRWIYWLMMACYYAAAQFAFTHLQPQEISQPSLWLVVLYPLLVWPLVAVQVKRWHDIGVTGWLALIDLIPLLGLMVSLIFNGLVRGTRGPNRYGPPFLLPVLAFPRTGTRRSSPCPRDLRVR